MTNLIVIIRLLVYLGRWKTRAICELPGKKEKNKSITEKLSGKYCSNIRIMRDDIETCPHGKAMK